METETSDDDNKKETSMMPYLISFAAGSCVGLLLLGIGMAVFW